jgi:hypothetical protein
LWKLAVSKTNSENSATTPGQDIEAEEFTRMYQLIYYSTSLVPALDEGGRKHIENIFGVATMRNAKSGVTGALAFNENYFAQVLEAAFDAVKATFAGIASDGRHTKVVVLQEGWVEAWDFAQWAMAYVEDEASIHVMSAHLQLQDLLSKERQMAAMALVEMMKFWLLRST